jgi:hypothetical protein
VSPNLAIGIVRLPLRRHDRLQRSLVRTHPAAAVMSAWVRKPVRLAAPAIGYHERHVFIEASTVDRLPPKSVLEHPHQNPNTTTGPELTVRYGGPNSHLSRPTARASNHRFDAAALAAGEDPGAWRPTRGVTIDGPQINCPARPAARAEHIEPRRPCDRRGTDRRRPQHVPAGHKLIPALDDGLRLGARGSIGNLPLLMAMSRPRVRTPMGQVSPESREATKRRRRFSPPAAASTI